MGKPSSIRCSHRQDLRSDLTPTVYERQKHPFIAPPSGDAKRNPFSAFLHEYIGDHRRSGIFDVKKVDELLAQHGRDPSERRPKC